ncbi:MAG TPA: DEAD/DEAH box helicase [Devosiaceae bacterium]|nr:DEAD/DEAH box helicase [Devosiaceae bacterium]
MNDKFSELGLSAKVAAAAVDAGYTVPTEIQIMAIPRVLEKRDVIGIAQTGTGKTAGFVLPMLTLLEKGRARARMPRTLILEPTRELAAQVHENFEKYGKNHKLTVALLIGGVSFDEQNKKLDRGADVLIATPGRLLDHFERGRLLMSGVDIFVIDEADRMLDMGFIPDIERIAALLPARHQTLFFSATMPPEIRRLTAKFLRSPVEIEVARQATPAENIEQRLLAVGSKPQEKRDALREQIRAAKNFKNAIIFCNRKRDVATLARSLKRHGFDAAELHGDMDQASRTATLDRFRKDELVLLVASDVAARGLDIPAVSHIFNFDVPTHAEDYVHRIGRTGRAGRLGAAITLVTSGERKYLDAIVKLIGRDIEWIGDAGARTARPAAAAPTRAPKSSGEAAPADRPARSSKAASRPARSRGGQRKDRPPSERPAETERPERRPAPEAAAKAVTNGAAADNKTPKRPDRGRDDAEPFGSSDQVPAFLRRPVRAAS